MEEQRIPDYAPGQELTLHPVDLAPIPGDEVPGRAEPPGPRRHDDRVSLVAVFDDIRSSRDCADDLERQGIETALLFRSPDEDAAAPDRTPAGGPDRNRTADPDAAAEESPAKRMGSGVTVGATLGATIGLITATFVVPPFGTLLATGSLLGTLTGAGIGSFLGGMVEQGITERDEAPPREAYPRQAALPPGGVLLIARADPLQVDEVRREIGRWRPVEIREQ